MRHEEIHLAEGPSGRTFSHLKYLALGAGLMYLLDPDRGHRRRTILRDKMVHEMHELSRSLSRAASDLANRAHGLAARARAAVMPDHADDWVVRERVRSAMGHAINHSGAIQVLVRDGYVMLRGPVLESEVNDLLAAVQKVRGVRGVENQLEILTHHGGALCSFERS